MKKSKFGILILIVLSLIYCNLGDVDYQEKLSVNQTTGMNYGDVIQLLKDTFRIDIKTISVDMEYFPESFYVNCEAEIVFNMFKDGTKPIIHLEPVIHDQNLVNKIELNGQTLDIANSSDVNIIDIQDSNQKAIEFQRNLNTGVEHLLKISYRKNLSNNYYIFTTQVSDIEGRGNEYIFPTINCPSELAEHHLRFRVNSSMKFRFIGSGFIQEVENQDHQEWTLDTEREIASYTLMFVLLPEDDTLFEKQTIDDVDVRIMAFKNGESINSAFDTLRSWLPELRSNLGPFPMPRGLSVMLVNSRGGMHEYYGGTISSLSALKHEVFHMYYGCSTVCATYRDSWIDEAVNEWYEHSADQNLFPIDDSYTSNIVSGRSPVALGFDLRAYNEGARIIQHIAVNLGGRKETIDFLSYVHKNYSFKPFTTIDFIKYLKDYSGLDYKDYFNNWVFSGEDTSGNFIRTKKFTTKHEVEITPPHSILNKYEEFRNGEKK